MARTILLTIGDSYLDSSIVMDGIEQRNLLGIDVRFVTSDAEGTKHVERHVLAIPGCDMDRQWPVQSAEEAKAEETADRNSEVVYLRAHLEAVQSRLARYPGPCATEEEHREWNRAFSDEPLIKKRLVALGEEAAVPEPTVRPVPLTPMQEGAVP